MITQEEITSLLENYGWNKIAKIKNPLMISFNHEEYNARINFYYTTGTITIQTLNGVIKTFRELSLEEFEQELSTTTF